MSPTTWQQLQDLVGAILEKPAAERKDFLEQSCADQELRRQVEELIQSFEQTGSYLENAVAGYATESFGAASSRTGQRIGAYELTEQIGRGGMGWVYRAIRVDDQFRQIVAVKVMLPGFGTTDELLARFRAERQILANLSHPNIARLIDGGVTADGVPYLVMEYIDGQSIDRFAADNKLSIVERLRLFRHICAAIQYAHQNLIVHRDIKPANVLVTPDGIPKLLDFGIAKLLNPETFGQTIAWTRPAERLMTPEYASPEQIRGETITTAVDVYGLGALLYELLTYKRPFDVRNLTPASIEHLICKTSPERPSSVTLLDRKDGAPAITREAVPPELDHIVLKAMHREPARRYASAAELSNDLSRYLQGFPIAARPDSWSYRARKFVVRHRLATVAAMLFFLTVSLLSVGIVIQARRAARQAQHALVEARATNDESNFAGTWQHEPSVDPLIFESFIPTETQGRTANAREILDRAASRVSGEMVAHPVVQARLLQMLGTTYYTIGLPAKAEPLLSRAYHLQTKFLGPNSPEAIASFGQLAEVKSSEGEYGQAVHDSQTAIEQSTAANGWNSDATAYCIGGLANVLWVNGKLNEAEQRYSQQIAILTKLHGENDLHTLRAESDLEVVLAQAGELARAEKLARHVLSASTRTLGPNAPVVGRNMLNLASLLTRTARYQEAESLAREAMRLFQRSYGALHPEVCRSLEILGEIERQLGHYTEAERDDNQALQTAPLLHGPKSPQTVYARDELAMTLLDEGDVKRASVLSNETLAAEISDGHTSKAMLATGYDHVGLVDLELKNFKDARQNITKGLALRQAYYGSENDRVALSLVHFGQVLYSEYDYPAAEQRFRQAIQIARTTFQGPHTLTADALFGLGTTLLAESRKKEAEQALRESLAMRRKLLPAQHPDIVRSEVALRKLSE